MRYKMYALFEGKMEVMIPSQLQQQNNMKGLDLCQYAWASTDGKIMVNVTKGALDLKEKELPKRLQDYYMGYIRDVQGFHCHHIRRRSINGYDYAELQYQSEMMGYVFYHVLILGVFQDSELIMSLQCMDADRKELEHVFSNIADSIQIRKNRQSKRKA